MSLRSFTFSSLLALSLSPAVGAGVLRVDAANGIDSTTCGSSQQPCRSIQQAVRNSITGDEIRVAVGTYTYVSALDNCTFMPVRPVVCILNREISILGGYVPPDWSSPSEDPSLTRIDGQGSYRGIALQQTAPTAPPAGLVLENLRIQNARAAGSAGSPVCPADLVGISEFGAGMLVDRATLVARSVEFVGNEVIGGDTSSAMGGSGSGGGLALRGAPAGSHLQDILFEDNMAQGGSGPERGGFAIGGGLFTYNSQVTGNGLVFRGNQALAGSSTGDGESACDGENADAQGGGMAAQLDSVVDFSNVFAFDNVAVGGNAGGDAGGAFGGGIYGELATVSITEATVRGNTATGGNGTNGGVGAGGGVFTGATQTWMERLGVFANRSSGGDGTNLRGAGGGGGGYFTRFTTTRTLTIRNSIFANNLTEMGDVGTIQGGGGGGLFLQGVIADLDHLTLARNQLGAAQMGGQAVSVLAAGGNPASVTLSASLIEGHDFFPDIPAVKVQSGNSLTFDEGLFVGNSVDTSAGDAGSGSFSGLSTMSSASTADFHSPDSPRFDYHLQASSPAVDAAPGSSASLDLDGESRSGVRDAGADEQSPLLFQDSFESGHLLRWQ